MVVVAIDLELATEFGKHHSCMMKSEGVPGACTGIPESHQIKAVWQRVEFPSGMPYRTLARSCKEKAQVAMGTPGVGDARTVGCSLMKAIVEVFQEKG